MKKVFFSILLIPVLQAGAQSYQDIRNAFALQQYSKAKTDIDKAMQDAAFSSKAEAYILKAAIYGALAADALKTNPAQAESLAAEADAAFKKYKEKDAGLQLLNDALYQNGPVNIYTIFYTTGYTDYSQKKWGTALDKISKAVNYSDLLIQKKIINASIDTNVLVLAGVAAENFGKKDAAVVYYGRLADAGIKGEGFETVYRYLVSYYFTQKNYTLFEKYKAVGKAAYPSSDYFSFDKIDFAVGTTTGFDNQVSAVQSLLKDDPGNFKANEVLGEVIYDELNKRLEKNNDFSSGEQLEAIMIPAFKKAALAKPGYAIPYLYMGDYFINKAVAIDNIRNVEKDPEKKKLLDGEYGTALLAAGDPYEKAVAIFQKNNNLEQKDKAQYKKAVTYLGDIAQYKKVKATTDPEKTKWAAEQAKWNALYESIK